MILPIDDKYRLTSDEACWRIEAYRSSRGWRPIKYYSTLSEAVTGLAHLKLRTSDAQTLADALAEVERISHRISRALEPQYIVERLEVDHAN